MARRGGFKIGENLPDGTMTFSGLAKATDIPIDTLRRWHKDGRLNHVDTQQHGKTNIYLFDVDSIVQARKIRDGDL